VPPALVERPAPPARAAAPFVPPRSEDPPADSFAPPPLPSGGPSPTKMSSTQPSASKDKAMGARIVGMIIRRILGDST
jgi:hypothetical protein